MFALHVQFKRAIQEVDSMVHDSQGDSGEGGGLCDGVGGRMLGQ